MGRRFSRRTKAAATTAVGVAIAAAFYGLAPVQANAAGRGSRIGSPEFQPHMTGPYLALTNYRDEPVAIQVKTAANPGNPGSWTDCYEVPAGMRVAPGRLYPAGNPGFLTVWAYPGTCESPSTASEFYLQRDNPDTPSNELLLDSKGTKAFKCLKGMIGDENFTVFQDKGQPHVFFDVHPEDAVGKTPC